MRATVLFAAAAAAALVCAGDAALGAPTKPPTKATTKAPTCGTLVEPSLCGSTSYQNVSVLECTDQTLSFDNMPPCCRLQAELEQPCTLPVPSGDSLCRTIELSAPSCPPDSDDYCNVEYMSLTMGLEFVTSNETCCNTCTCYGDPHCESFTGLADTWVICDGRSADPKSPNKCPITQAMCLQQRDQNNQTCMWQTNPNGEKWTVALQGSPCVFQPSPNPPNMIMYAADDFELNLIMGERSVVRGAIITDSGGAQYSITSDNCFADAAIRSPWRVNLNDPNPPTNNTQWLPFSWSWSPVEGGDILWNVFGLPSQITLTFRCTRTTIRKAGRTLKGPTRLNVEQLVEPFNWQNGGRVDPRGFCADGYITKEGTHGNTDNILANGQCIQEANDLDVAKLLCSSGTTKAGIPGCQYSWCMSVRSDWEQCMTDITTYGWDVVWCASQTTQSKMPADCNAGNCKQCVSDIQDFGWPGAITRWEGTGASDVQCVGREGLQTDLLTCQTGVRLEYLDSAANLWIPYLAVPSTTVLCDNQLTFDSRVDAPLFANRIRLQQCSLPATCLSDMCAPEVGFSSSFTFQAEENVQETVMELYQAGILICNPEEYPGNPQGCVGESVPALCPCT